MDAPVLVTFNSITLPFRATATLAVIRAAFNCSAGFLRSNDSATSITMPEDVVPAGNYQLVLLSPPTQDMVPKAELTAMIQNAVENAMKRKMEELEEQIRKKPRTSEGGSEASQSSTTTTATTSNTSTTPVGQSPRSAFRRINTPPSIPIPIAIQPQSTESSTTSSTANPITSMSHSPSPQPQQQPLPPQAALDRFDAEILTLRGTNPEGKGPGKENGIKRSK